jgi:phenylacetate-coenzyme A ligase PaaK-like adenylate-forming protein
MSPATVTRRGRLADVAGGLRAARRLSAHDRVGRTELLAWQARRVRELEAFARARSPFYRDRDPAQTLDKATLMAHYDDVLTDRRLSLARLDAHLDALAGDELLDGEYRVMATGGTTGRRAVFPYSRREWALAMAAFFRWTAITGRRPSPRRRVAVVLAPGPWHMTWRYARTADVGLMRVLRLDAARTPEDLIAALDAFGPQEISGYPSALALLAHAQREGRLAIAPEFVATAAEVRTPEMEAAMVDAWGVRPFDMYGITEGGITATDCVEHAGLHVLEDQVRAEVLDEDGAPVPDGEVGRLVVTPLHGRTLPLLRYEMGDLVRATTEPCACGRPYLRLLEIQGRQDDVLRLPAARGGTIAVHPILVRSPMAAVPGLDRYQLTSDDGMLRVRVTLRPGADAARATATARDGLRGALRDVGAAAGVEVELVDAIPCSALGKHRLVAQA